MSQNVPADDRVLQFFPAEFSGTWVLTRMLRIGSLEPLRTKISQKARSILGQN